MRERGGMEREGDREREREGGERENKTRVLGKKAFVTQTNS